MDEMQLRSLAVAVRSALPQLMPDDVADSALMDKALGSALGRTPGRALAELRRLLVEDAAPEVRRWVDERLEKEPDPVRSGESGGAPPTGIDAHELVLWVEERDEDADEPLVRGESYTLVAMAGTEGSESRYDEEVLTPSGEQMSTMWVLSSTTVQLETDPADPHVRCTTGAAGDETQWLATFPLGIPVEGDSVRHRLRCTPLAGPEARVDAVVSVRDDVYRRITVSFNVVPGSDAPPPLTETEPDPVILAPVSTLVVGRLPAAHVGLRPNGDWQRPRRTMLIDVMTPERALVTIEEQGVKAPVKWALGAGSIEPRIQAVRKDLESLRQSFPGYFELIDPERLVSDLAQTLPYTGWLDDGGHIEEPFDGAWADVASSGKLRDLAFHGHELFTALFADQDLRLYLGTLEPGDRIELTWLDELGGRVPHLPLPLLYLGEVDNEHPVDPLLFLGLRHRLGYNRRQSNGSRALGAWQSTTRAHLLYWGKEGTDPVAAEAARHAAELKQWEPLRLLPDGEPRIDNVAAFLTAPEPAPVALIYFYCHCVADPGEDPYLRFGPTKNPGDVLRRSMMGTAQIADKPVVFVNACGTAESEPQWVNQLMDGFLDRGCRGYIGTEGRVPPGFAARFATTFFSFLYGTPDRARAPIGEAMTQARRFLWLRYRNLGGLYYNFVNDFLIYAADDDDVTELGAATHE